MAHAAVLRWLNRYAATPNLNAALISVAGPVPSPAAECWARNPAGPRPPSSGGRPETACPAQSGMITEVVFRYVHDLASPWLEHAGYVLIKWIAAVLIAALARFCYELSADLAHLVSEIFRHKLQQRWPDLLPGKDDGETPADDQAENTGQVAEPERRGRRRRGRHRRKRRRGS